MARYGYARVSTDRQHTDGQEERLKAAGCERVFSDEGVTGKVASRPGWDKCLASLRSGDILVVTKLDRVGRSLINLIDVVGLLGERGVDLVVLDQAIDTTTPNGKLLFHILSALAEWEASMIRERTIEGLAAAKVRHGGKLPGRGPSLSPDKVKIARELFANREASGMSAARIAEVVGCSRATLYRHLREA
jgi:DNA invertase Pin-like site-specific DNA recombinase